MNHCSYCDYQSRHYFKLLAHFRDSHAFQVGFTITCGVEHCQKKYKSVRVLTNHIRSKHRWFAEKNLRTRTACAEGTQHSDNEADGDTEQFFEETSGTDEFDQVPSDTNPDYEKNHIRISSSAQRKA